jgi:hypothetical protein
MGDPEMCNIAETTVVMSFTIMCVALFVAATAITI